MCENNLYYYSSGNYYDQFIPPTYYQPPISIAPYSYTTTIPYSTYQFAYHDQGLIPNSICVPVHPANALRLARQRAQDFADYLCKKYSTSEIINTNLSDLPDDIIANILQRLGTFEILVNARRVCKAWRTICEDPAMWRVIYIENLGRELSLMKRQELEKMCRQAIDRSQGQLVDIKIEHIASNELLEYLAENKRSSQLRRLQIAWSFTCNDDSWSDLFQKSPLLEEISLTNTPISKETVSNAGQYCLKLKAFKYLQLLYAKLYLYRPSKVTRDGDDFVITIAKGMPQLRHLELVGSEMTNTGLQAILDGCPHLVSLDLRRCFNVNLDSSCGMLCKEHIKDMRLPYDYYMDDPNYLKDISTWKTQIGVGGHELAPFI